jgi:hypothetical protein
MNQNCDREANSAGVYQRLLASIYGDVKPMPLHLWHAYKEMPQLDAVRNAAKFSGGLFGGLILVAVIKQTK